MSKWNNEHKTMCGLLVYSSQSIPCSCSYYKSHTLYAMIIGMLMLAMPFVCLFIYLFVLYVVVIVFNFICEHLKRSIKILSIHRRRSLVSVYLITIKSHKFCNNTHSHTTHTHSKLNVWTKSYMICIRIAYYMYIVYIYIYFVRCVLCECPCIFGKTKFVYTHTHTL